MKKRKVPTNGLIKPSPSTSQPTRTTIVIPAHLDQNLTACSMIEGRPKNEVIQEAIAYYLEKAKGLQPDKKPDVTITYSN